MSEKGASRVTNLNQSDIKQSTNSIVAQTNFKNDDERFAFNKIENIDKYISNNTVYKDRLSNSSNFESQKLDINRYLLTSEKNLESMNEKIIIKANMDIEDCSSSTSDEHEKEYRIKPSKLTFLEEDYGEDDTTIADSQRFIFNNNENTSSSYSLSYDKTLSLEPITSDFLTKNNKNEEIACDDENEELYSNESTTTDFFADFIKDLGSNFINTHIRDVEHDFVASRKNTLKPLQKLSEQDIQDFICDDLKNQPILSENDDDYETIFDHGIKIKKKKKEKDTRFLKDTAKQFFEQQKEERLATKLQLVEEDFLRIFLNGFQEVELENNYQEFISKQNTKKFSLIMLIICLTSTLFSIMDFFKTRYWYIKLLLVFFSLIIIIYSINVKIVVYKLRKILTFTMVSSVFCALLANVYLTKKSNFYEIIVSMTFFHTFNENGIFFPVLYFLMSLVYITVLLFYEKDLIEIFPNDMLINNSVTLLFINVFGFSYNYYIEKIYRQIYLRTFASKKIVNSCDFSSVVTCKTIYSLLPQTLAKMVLNGKTIIQKPFFNTVVVYVKLYGIEELFYQCSNNKDCDIDIYMQRPNRKQCIDIVHFIFEELDSICDFYAMEKLYFNNNYEYVMCSNLSIKDYNRVHNACRAAIDIRNFICSFADQLKFYFLQCSIGVYRSDLDVDLQFSTKYKFDIFGKALNKAKVLSKNCKINHIHIGKSIKDKIDKIDFEYVENNQPEHETLDFSDSQIRLQTYYLIKQLRCIWFLPKLYTEYNLKDIRFIDYKKYKNYTSYLSDSITTKKLFIFNLKYRNNTYSENSNDLGVRSDDSSSTSQNYKYGQKTFSVHNKQYLKPLYICENDNIYELMKQNESYVDNLKNVVVQNSNCNYNCEYRPERKKKIVLQQTIPLKNNEEEILKDCESMSVHSLETNSIQMNIFKTKNSTAHDSEFLTLSNEDSSPLNKNRNYSNIKNRNTQNFDVEAQKWYRPLKSNRRHKNNNDLDFDTEFIDNNNKQSNIDKPKEYGFKRKNKNNDNSWTKKLFSDNIDRIIAFKQQLSNNVFKIQDLQFFSFIQQHDRYSQMKKTDEDSQYVEKNNDHKTKSAFDYFVFEDYCCLRWKRINISQQTIKNFETQFKNNSLFFFSFMLMYYIVKLFLSSNDDSFIIPEVYSISFKIHICIACLIILRMLMNIFLKKDRWDILLFILIYAAEFYETFLVSQKSVYFSYFTAISMCYISLFMKFKLKNMILLFFMYAILYIANSIQFSKDYNLIEPMIVLFLFFLSILSKSFINYCIAKNYELYEIIVEKTKTINFNEITLSTILLHSFPTQWIATLNDKNFKTSRTSNNCIFTRIKLVNYEELRKLSQIGSNYTSVCKNKLFSDIEQIIDKRVDYFNFEKIYNQCGEYIILANMEDENINIKFVSEKMVSLCYDLYDSIYKYIQSLKEGEKYVASNGLELLFVVDYGCCTTALIGLKKMNCNVFGIPNTVTKHVVERERQSKILFTEKFVEQCPLFDNHKFLLISKYKIINGLETNIYRLQEKELEKRIE